MGQSRQIKDTKMIHSNKSDFYRYMEPYLKIKFLSASFELGIIKFIMDHEGKITYEDVSDALKLHERSCRLLLNILKQYHVIHVKKNKIFIDKKFLEDYILNPALITDFLYYMNLVYKDLEYLPDIIKKGMTRGNVQNFWHYKHNSSACASFLSSYTRNLCVKILKNYNFDKYKYILDVGGNDGEFMLHLCNSYPILRGGIFDLSEYYPLAKNKLHSLMHNGRVNFFSGNFLKDSIPQKADLIILKSVLNDWPDSEAKIILHNIYAALPFGGRVLIIEHLKDNYTDINSYLFNIIFMWLISPNHDFRKSTDYIQMLTKSEFKDIKLISTSIKDYYIIEGTKF
jgi:hypothetical protein